MAVQEQYRKANDMIHAPEDLIRRTEAAVRQEKNMCSGVMPLLPLPPVSVWYASASGISL